METGIIPAVPIVNATKAVDGARRNRPSLGTLDDALGHL
jgi:hypothetical protein